MKGKERGKFLLSLNIIDSLSLLINNRTQPRNTERLIWFGAIMRKSLVAKSQ